MRISSTSTSSDAFEPLLKGLLAQPLAAEVDALRYLLDDVLQAKVDPRDLLAVLTALSARPWNPDLAVALVETIETGATGRDEMRARLAGRNAINIVGTGGGVPSFNISTTSAIVAAAAGVTVLKSGSTSYNSSAGAVDFLKTAGIAMACNATQIEANLDCFGIAFYTPGDFSPLLKRCAMAAAPQPLKLYGQILNRIGPFLKMVPTAAQLTGVATKQDLAFYVDVFQRLGRYPTWLVHGHVGLDEACALGTNTVIRLNSQGQVREELNGTTLGFTPGRVEDIAGGNPATCVALTQRLFNGGGPELARDCVILNAALLINLSNPDRNLENAIDAARSAIGSGRAAGLLANLRQGR